MAPTTILAEQHLENFEKILKKHIENARFFKVLEESELCDIDYPKEMQAMLAKQGKSS